MLIEIHMLKNYPPVNLNRDNNNTPKSCMFGGVARSRVSSQCLKRSWRTSPILKEMVGEEHLGIRTRKLPDLVAQRLKELGVNQEYIDLVRPKITYFGKNKDKNKDGNGSKNKDKNTDGKTGQVIFYAPEDIQAVAETVKGLLDGCPSVKEVKKLTGKALQETVKGAEVRPVTLDMALFGRMVTSNAFRDVEASMQVAHAISTNKLNQESDFFIAMDDLLSGSSMEESGSAMIGDIDYNSACYYHYASLDTDLLAENLKYSPDAQDLIRKAVPALIRTMALTSPSGKQNSFAGHTLPSAILVELKEEKVPVSLANAFVRPVRPEQGNGYDLIRGSIQQMAAQMDDLQEGFGLKVEKRLWFCPKPYEGIEPASGHQVCNSLPQLVEEVAAALE